MNSLLAKVDHRQYPPPRTPWVMTQTWSQLLFAHWTVPADLMRSLVPADLELDLFEGQAYIGVVPFKMSDVRLRGTPAIPGLSTFLELNVRTYVTVDGVAGVFFFSLDASNPIAVRIARAWYHLPYFDADMSLVSTMAEEQSDLVADGHDNSGWVHYVSKRFHAPSAVNFCARYRPIAEVQLAKKGSLESFLTDRYCLYVQNRQGVVCRGEIHHEPWPLQLAEAEIDINTMVQPYGFDLSSAKPLLHFSSRLTTIEWPIGPVVSCFRQPK